MNLRRSYGIWSFFILFIAAGCESDYDFNLNAVPKLTIISHLNPDDTAPQQVYAFASLSASDPSKFYTPDNLVVDITEEGSNISVRLDSVEGDKPRFLIPQGFVKAGNKYSITAFAPGFPIVQASTLIPKPSTVTNLVIKDYRVEPSQAHDFKKIIFYTLSFDINHFESNKYYHLVFHNQYKGDIQRYVVNPQPSDVLPVIQHYEYGLLLDREDLTDNTLAFNFKDWMIDDHELVRVYVELRTITHEYYKYHSSLTRQLILRQDPFAEPVTIFNNIKGGYGNFSAFSPDVTSSDLPR